MKQLLFMLMVPQNIAQLPNKYFLKLCYLVRTTNRTPLVPVPRVS